MTVLRKCLFFWRNGTRKNYLADDVAFGVWEKDSSFPHTPERLLRYGGFANLAYLDAGNQPGPDIQVTGRLGISYSNQWIFH